MRNINGHLITNLNVIDPGVDQLFADGRKADVVFSDPPWGSGNVSFWATKALKDTGVQPQLLTYDQLLERVFGLIQKYCVGDVYLETGLRWEKQNVEWMERIGLKNIEVEICLYKGGAKMLPNLIMFGSFRGATGNLKREHHQTGVDVSARCVAHSAVPGGIVFDPCCGMGYSARAALLAGMQFRGNELNSVRLAKTIAKLEAAPVPVYGFPASTE